MDRQRILFLLEQLRDPKSGKDLVRSGLIKNVQVKENQIMIEVPLSEVRSDFKNQLNLEIQTKILSYFPHAEIDIHFIHSEGEDSSRILPQVKNVLAVASGKGGVGKSTVSLNLAKALYRNGFRVGVLDADLYGPSIPLLLDIAKAKPRVEKIMGQNKIIPIEKDGLSVMSVGFIVDSEQAVVLRGPRLGGIIKQFLNETIWPELDYLIVDLPPGTGDIQLTLVQSVPVTASVIVTSPDALSVADAIKALNMFLIPNINVPILGVVENMSYFQPIGKREKYKIFGEGGGKRLAEYGNTDFLAKIPFLRALQSSEKSEIQAMSNMHYDLLASKCQEKVNWRNNHLAPTKVVLMGN